jgi:dihydrofolate reductase
MPRLIYSAIASLDGFVADRDGAFDWAAPSEEVHAFVNELERPVGTYLYGRRMYETMAPWDSLPLDGKAGAIRDFAEIWREADKVVYSRTLGGVSTARTRLEHELDPDAVRRLKAGAGRDISVGGPTLAGQVIDAGLVDEVQLFLKPVAVGGGTHSLPLTAEVHLNLREQRRFRDGTVFLRYALAPD